MQSRSRPRRAATGVVEMLDSRHDMRVKSGNARNSWIELFATITIVVALFLAVLPSVSAARRIPHVTSQQGIRSPDAIDHAIAELPQSWLGIVGTSVACGAVAASLIVLSRRLVGVRSGHTR